MGKSNRRGILVLLGAAAVGLLRFAEDIAKLIPGVLRGLRGFDDENISRNSNCTDVYVNSFQWERAEYSQDQFTANVVNQSDTAGSIEIVLSFYYTSDLDQVIEKVYERSTVRADSSKQVVFMATSPEESEYATITISEQGCR